MRNVLALLCFLVLFCGDSLLAASSPLAPPVAEPQDCPIPPPAPGWTCVNGGWVPSPFPPPVVPEPPSPLVPQVIGVGEEVTGTLHGDTWTAAGLSPAVFDMLFELTAPSDGTLILRVNWTPEHGCLDLSVEDAVLSFFPNWWPPTEATLEVAAGRTYRILVSTPCIWELIEDVDFVLTTSIEPGPVVIPPGCETPPPARDWICLNGGWLPPNHPLAIANSAGSTPPPPSLPPPPPADTCTTPDPFMGIPGMVGVCVNGGWVPAGHPLAIANSPGSAPPAPSLPPPPPADTCTTPDPFVGIPGMVGVCVNGGWVPAGHPLARGGG